MAQKGNELSLADLRLEVDKLGLRWQPGETAIATLPHTERKKYLGLTVTKAELKKMADAVKKQTAEERTFGFESQIRMVIQKSILQIREWP